LNFLQTKIHFHLRQSIKTPSFERTCGAQISGML
jgi:hypothetical protein